MRKSFKVLAAVLAVAVVGAVAAFAGCGGTTTYRFEAEKAVLWSDEESIDAVWGAWGMSDYYITGVEDVESASGGASVGFFSYEGSSITFNIVSDSAVEGATLTLCAAACTEGYDWTTWTSTGIADFDTSEHANLLQVNGTSVALTGVLPGNDDTDEETNYYKWGTATATIDLKEGTNAIVLTVDDSGVSINVDYIEIATSATLTWTETNN